MTRRTNFVKCIVFFRSWWILLFIMSTFMLGKGDVIYAQRMENVSISKLQSKYQMPEFNLPIKRNYYIKEKIITNPLQLPEKVTIVRDEVALVKHLLYGMEKHQSYFAVYYPGIREDFIQYGKQSMQYDTFLEHLAIKNSYLMGTISGYCISIKGEYVVFQFHYNTTLKEEQWMNRYVATLAELWNRESDDMKIKLAHDYLVHKVQYDARYKSPFDALYRGRGLCMSYALAFQRIMQELDIPCIYIATNQHAWNMVKLGRYWYNVDVTYDDADGSYRYFLKADKDFPNHSRPDSGGYKHMTLAKKSYVLEGIY